MNYKLKNGTIQNFARLRSSLVLSLEVDLIAAPKSYGIYQFYRSLKIKNASVRAMYSRILRRI